MTDFLKRWAFGLRLAVVAALVVAAWFHGGHVTRQQWETDKAVRVAAAKVLQDKIDELQAKQKEPTIVEVPKYIQTVKYVTKTIERIKDATPSLIPSGTPDLPGGFRVQHDAAATAGDEDRPVPGPAGGADGATGEAAEAAPAGSGLRPPAWSLLGGLGGEPVSVRTAVDTVADNYGACLKNAARLERLQNWLRKQYLLNPDPKEPRAFWMEDGY